MMSAAPWAQAIYGVMCRVRGALLVILLSWVTAPAVAADLRTDLWVTNGAVRAIAVDSVAGRIYLGGDFTEVGPADALAPRVARSHLAAFDLRSGEVTSWDPSANDTVYALWLSANRDTLYVGGAFTAVGGQVRNRLVALDTVVGAPRTLWEPSVNGVVRAIVPSTSGNTLYVGGAFDAVNGLAHRALAEIGMVNNPGVTGFGVPALFEVGADVYALALAANGLFIGGDFVGIFDPVKSDDPAPTPLPPPPQRLAAVDLSTFRLSSAWAPVIDDGEVRALSYLPGQSVIFVGGSFTKIDGASHVGLAEFDVDKGQGKPQAWNPQLVGVVDTLTRSLDRSALYLGGQFSAIAGVSRTNLAGVNANTGVLLSDWNAAADGEVFSLSAAAGAQDAPEETYVLYVGGAFTSIDGNARPGLAALSAPAPEREPPITTADPAGRFFSSADLPPPPQNCNDGSLPLPPGQPACGLELIVSLVCDDGDGSGCAATYYTLDGSEPTTDSLLYQQAISIRASTELKFFSIDRVGNVGAVVREAYVFETDPPLTTADPPSRVFDAKRLEIRLICIDADSGCAATYYTLDGSKPTAQSQRYTGPIVISKDTVLQYFSVDVAGNVEGIHRNDYVSDRGRVGAFGLELLLMLPALALMRRRQPGRS
ncbi:MAG: chitobiase/beta-hexosaminidase C-terminal domain-containing protein [Chromatiales bacterium]|nr:chitobiase/beta-hexosaminidase C-terminal domain-containing protein [Chromatiales bacterium]